MFHNLLLIPLVAIVTKAKIGLLCIFSYNLSSIVNRKNKYQSGHVPFNRFLFQEWL